jgi:hypothetical protein
VDVEEAQHLMDSGIEVGVGTVSIVVKEPFLQSLNAQNIQATDPLEDLSQQQQQEEEQTAHASNEDSNRDKCSVEEGVNVMEALSVIFGIPLEPLITDLPWSREDPCALCQKCAEVVTILYSAFQEFNSLSNQTSYVAKGIKQFLNKINSLNNMSIYAHVTQESETTTNVSQDNVGPAQPIVRGRNSKNKNTTQQAMKSPAGNRFSKINSSTVKMEVDEQKNEDSDDADDIMISGDLGSDSSSDSLSDFETDIKG